MDIRHVAEMARLQLSHAEEVRMKSELQSILCFVEQMDAADAHEPSGICWEGVLRKDEVRPSMARETLLALAPSATAEYLTVPQTLPGEGEA